MKTHTHIMKIVAFILFLHFLFPSFSTHIQSPIKRNNKQSISKRITIICYLNDSLSMVIKHSTRKNMNQNQIVSVEKTENSQKIRTMIWMTMGMFFVVVVAVYLLWRKNTATFHGKYEEIIKINKKKENSQPTGKAADIKKASSLDIPDEIVSVLLEKLEKFENTDKFLKKGLTISSLAHQMNTNPKYLSKVIKEYTGKSFNNYINGLRIDYISMKICEDPSYRLYKISYLAELCGFSSREVFTVVFKKVTGINPSDFMEQVKNEEKDV